VRVVHLSDPATVAVDVVAWGLVHAGAGYAAHRTSVAWLSRDRPLFRERRVEGGGRLYTRRLRIARWKDRLPEAGDQGGLERFVVETRRAELAHWLAAAPGPLFALWNPPAVVPVMVLYGALVNAPFIAVQRYNRIRASRVLRSREARAAAAAGTARVSGSPPGAAPARTRCDRDTSGNSMP
jgi:glycosyl-4,4'-diaponeurosporenoate acyltransferase